MARIRVLNLTYDKLGSAETQTFALVIDQAEGDITKADTESLDAFAKQCGARAVLVHAKTLDVV